MWLCLSRLRGTPIRVRSSGRRPCSMWQKFRQTKSHDRQPLRAQDPQEAFQRIHTCAPGKPSPWILLDAVGQRSSKNHRNRSTERRLLPHPTMQEGTLSFSFSCSSPSSGGGRREKGRWYLIAAVTPPP